MQPERPLVSIVVPCYEEEQALPALLEALEGLFAAQPGLRFEVVAVDDGSRDGTLAALRAAADARPWLRVVSLSRNFGSHAALLAGFRTASGDAVTFIAADLQDPPELVVRLATAWREGAEIVWAIRAAREDPWSVRLTSGLAHRLFRWLTGLDAPVQGVEVFLADRKVIDAVVGQSWRNCSVLMAFYWAGFRRAEVTYTKAARRQGRSKWTFARRVRLFVDTMVGFSYLPLRLMALVGLATAALGFAYAAFIVGRWLLVGQPTVVGWPSLMVVTLVLGGLLLAAQGVLGEYLWRTLEEARQRPMYLVREVYPPPPPPGT